MKSNGGSGQPGTGREAARRKCLALLEYKDRSEQKLREKLKEKGFPEEEADDAVEYARSFGYVNDRRFAENFIRTHCERMSRREMERKLLEQGISSGTIGEALSGYEGEEESALERFLMKKAKTWDIADPSERQKLIRSAMNHGFPYHLVKSAIEKMDLTD